MSGGHCRKQRREGGAGAETHKVRPLDLEVRLGLEWGQRPLVPAGKSEGLPRNAMEDQTEISARAPGQSAFCGASLPLWEQNVCISIHALLLTSCDPGQFF